MKKKFIGIIFTMLLLVVGSFSTVLAADDAEIGTANLNNTTENSAKVGDTLLHPEKGWKRYDDTNSNISYIGTWIGKHRDFSSYPSFNTYANTLSGTNAIGDKIRFKFTGSKLQLMAFRHFDHSGFNVKIDGIDKGNISLNIQDASVKVVYTNTTLDNKEHCVELTCLDKSITGGTLTNFCFDAVDIDENGELKPYDENNTDIKPTLTGNRGFLTITMTNGQSREYDLSMNEINKFTEWYNNRDKGNGSLYYTFNKNPIAEAFTKRVENLVFNKISQFDIDEYDKK